MVEKRYKALYIHPNFFDGFWDNEKNFYLNDDELKQKIYENLSNEEIEEILNRNEEEIEYDEVDGKMSEIKIAFEGLGIVLLGLITVVWQIVKIISCLFIAGLISTKMGLGGNYWWFASIIIFTFLCKILFLGNNNETYSNLVDNYNEKVNEEKKD